MAQCMAQLGCAYRTGGHLPVRNATRNKNWPSVECVRSGRESIVPQERSHLPRAHPLDDACVPGKINGVCF
eukprot:8387465-Pyramimonas_sp.AAC.1